MKQDLSKGVHIYLFVHKGTVRSVHFLWRPPPGFMEAGSESAGLVSFGVVCQKFGNVEIVYLGASALHHGNVAWIDIIMRHCRNGSTKARRAVGRIGIRVLVQQRMQSFAVDFFRHVNVVDVDQPQGNLHGNLKLQKQRLGIGFLSTQLAVQLFQVVDLSTQNSIGKLVDGRLAAIPMDVDDIRTEGQTFHCHGIPPVQIKIFVEKLSFDAERLEDDRWGFLKVFVYVFPRVPKPSLCQKFQVRFVVVCSRHQTLLHANLVNRVAIGKGCFHPFRHGHTFLFVVCRFRRRGL
mmetsp:Transcript_87/g.196  ORF Transcript_87/g.196 Transcript_87/m.196 type:complete len:292 (+) Transcript_87:358-1233(+)